MGRRQAAARLTFSWKSPRLAVPSPKLHTHTRSDRCFLNASAAPVAVPIVVPRSPATHGRTLRWNGPLNATERPLLYPADLPSTWAIRRHSSAPRIRYTTKDPGNAVQPHR